MTDDPGGPATVPVNRETWLNLMAEKLAPSFAALGHPLPPYKVSIGFTSSGMRSNVLAECWNKKNSAGGFYEIFIRPDRDDTMQISGSLAHELAHAAVGFEHQHGGEFAKVCLALGLLRPMTSTPIGPKFRELVEPFIAELGPIPHARIRSIASVIEPPEGGGGDGGGGDGEPYEAPSSNAKPKQGTRLLKVSCPECGYTARVSKRWLDVGAPLCPSHGEMQSDADAA